MWGIITTGSIFLAEKNINSRDAWVDSDLKIDIVIIQNTLCTKRELKLLPTHVLHAATCESVYNGLMSIELLHEIVPIESI